MVHLDDAQVSTLLPSPAEQVALMRETLLALADGSASVTPKTQVVHEEGGFANAMPAAWPERGLLGVKWVTVTPSNRARGREMISGLMVLSAADGSTRATMDAAELTAQRTAAVTGASLALDDRPITFVGTGVQARSHARVIEALGRGPLTVWGRRPEALRELAAWCAEHTPGLELRTTTDRAEALAGAGVVISALPIGLTDAALHPGDVAADATLLPIDYASVAGAEISRTGTVVADQRRAVRVAEAPQARQGLPPRDRVDRRPAAGRPAERPGRRAEPRLRPRRRGARRRRRPRRRGLTSAPPVGTPAYPCATRPVGPDSSTPPTET
ncbi:ornithine cyclodeaminase [Brachybacterium paraconglomeratum]